MPNFPGPEQAEAFAVPGNDGFWFDDGQGRSPIALTSHSQIQMSRSVGVSLGRFTERRRMSSWCRRARFSNWSVVRDLKAADALLLAT